jgi:hypothetical protein
VRAARATSPKSHHGGKVEGRDSRYDAQGFARAGEVDAGGEIGRDFALEELGNAARELDDFKTPGDFASSIVHGLSVFQRNLFGEFVGTLGEGASETKKYLAAPGGGHLGPRKTRNASGLYGDVRLVLIRIRDLGDFSAGCQIENVTNPSRGC